jgi:hypothetical protein
MAQEAVFVVGLVMLGVLFALAMQVEQLRARVLRQERTGAELSRTVATVQGWAANELRARRDELTVERVASAAEATQARLEKQRADALEEEPTKVWTGADAAHVRTEAAAGGAPRPPQATPRAALLVTVAPPASAPPFPPSEAGILAAGLGRPKSVRSAPRPPAGVDAAPTLLSMQAQGGVSASPGRPAEPDDEQRDTTVMRAPTPASPARRSSHDDGKAPTVLALNPPMYARVKPTSSPAPLAAPALSGAEDLTEDAARSPLGPDEQTPPRRGREAVLMRAFQPSATEERT